MQDQLYFFQGSDGIFGIGALAQPICVEFGAPSRQEEFSGMGVGGLFKIEWCSVSNAIYFDASPFRRVKNPAEK